MKRATRIVTYAWSAYGLVAAFVWLRDADWQSGPYLAAAYAVCVVVIKLVLAAAQVDAPSPKYAIFTHVESNMKDLPGQEHGAAENG